MAGVDSSSSSRSSDQEVRSNVERQNLLLGQAAQANGRGQPQTYLERLRGEQPRQIDASTLPDPIMVGNVPTITLPKVVVERGRRYCEFALIGRLDFKKVSLNRVRVIAADVWKPTKEWKVIPLGKGFFMLRLESKDDYVRIWSQAWKVGS
ncbi:hypothetical protein ACHQM5_006925 [Ranunculus cassubicifolius]